MYTRPTVADFKAYFTRDFPYAPYIPDPIDPVNNPPTQDPNVGVTDGDITKAMGQTECSINDEIIPDQQTFNIMYLLLVAHYLVIDLRMAAQGIEGNYSWITSSKSVGSVSESFAIPQYVQDNPVLLMLSKTNYGAKYVNLIMPYIIGNIFTVPGATYP